MSLRFLIGCCWHFNSSLVCLPAVSEYDLGKGNMIKSFFTGAVTTISMLNMTLLIEQSSTRLLENERNKSGSEENNADSCFEHLGNDYTDEEKCIC